MVHTVCGFDKSITGEEIVLRRGLLTLKRLKVGINHRFKMMKVKIVLGSLSILCGNIILDSPHHRVVRFSSK